MAVYLVYAPHGEFPNGHKARYETLDEAKAQAAYDLENRVEEPMSITDDADPPATKVLVDYEGLKKLPLPEEE